MNPKYLHPELHFNVLVVDADLTGMHRSDISLWVIGALFQCLDIFGIFNIFLLLYERKLVHKYIRHTIFSISDRGFWVYSTGYMQQMRRCLNGTEGSHHP